MIGLMSSSVILRGVTITKDPIYRGRQIWNACMGGVSSLVGVGWVHARREVLDSLLSRRTHDWPSMRQAVHANSRTQT